MMKTPLIQYCKGGLGGWFATLPIISLSLMALCVSIGTAALPYTPTSLDQILVRLPDSIVALRLATPIKLSEDLIEAGEKKRVSTQLTEQLKKAQEFINLAQQDNEPSWYGYAHAALAPWWDNSINLPKLALLKAIILQQRHEFPEALLELDKVLLLQPRNVQARLIRAQVNMILAQYGLAIKDCQQILWLENPVMGINCLAQVQGLTGKGQQAMKRLNASLNSKFELSETQLLELHISLATIAHRYDDSALALFHYQKAYAIRPNNNYLLEQYSDFLIENRQAGLLLDLFVNNKSSLDLKIKRVQFLKQSGVTVPSNLMLELTEYFSDAKIRKNLFPHKEYAKWLLLTSHEYERALNSALENWAMQKAPGDALLVLQAAVLSQQLQRAQPVILWLKNTGLYDYRIEAKLLSFDIGALDISTSQALL
mgnify:CR=1 FL=1